MTSENLSLVVGRVYRAKRPARTGSIIDPVWNDRMIIWIGEYDVQYDSPAITLGRRYPRVSKEAFLKWAHSDITDQMPNNEWRSAKIS